MLERRDEILDYTFEPPITSVEAAVASIAGKVLGVDKVGRSDSFYELGGTSIQAIQICTRIENDLGVRALPIWLLEEDVLAEFVERLAQDGEAVRH